MAMPRTIADKIIDKPDAAIDEIVARCGSDMRGAVKALLLINEQLELELDRAHGVVTLSTGTKCTLH
jgi:hypothetical protein